MYQWHLQGFTRPLPQMFEDKAIPVQAFENVFSIYKEFVESE